MIGNPTLSGLRGVLCPLFTCLLGVLCPLFTCLGWVLWPLFTCLGVCCPLSPSAACACGAGCCYRHCLGKSIMHLNQRRCVSGLCMLYEVYRSPRYYRYDELPQACGVGWGGWDLLLLLSQLIRMSFGTIMFSQLRLGLIIIKLFSKFD